MGKTGFAARTAAATAALLALLLAAATAAPAAVFELSGDARAEKPDIAVAEDGTAHLAWNISVGIPGDDQLLYCRVPRGGRACAATRLIALPKIDFDGPHILLTRSGDVVLISKRCCFPGAPVFAVTSTDGGGSFGPPVQIADEFSGGSEWEVELGPGDFSVALSGGNSGPDYAAIWGAAPLDGSDLDPKTELATFPKAYFNTTGFPSPTSPIAAYSDLENVYMRAWDGSGDYNDASNWTPEAYVATGSEPKLVSGPRGVFLIYHGSKAPFQYLVRRFDGSGFPAKTQRVVSDPGTRQSAIFRDFLEDAGGSLHAVFRQRSEKGSWGLRHRVSDDGGVSWGAIETLAAGAAADDLFNLRVGAAPDGGGGIVGDHNGEGPIWFAPFRGRGGSGSCAATVKLGKAVARALTGCFQKAGKLRVATGAVKVNGVDIEPGGGGNASASAAFKVIASPGQRTLKTSGKATVRVGEVVLEKGPVAWRLPPGNGKVVRLNSPDGSVFRDLGKYAKRLFDFPVDGDAELLIAGKGARVPANLRMPGLIGGVTGLTTLRTDQAGQVLAGMKIDVPNAAIGLLRIAGIDVTYDGADRFTGTAKIKLPPAYSDGIAKASVTFGFEDGELSVVEVAPPPFNPTLPIVGSPPTPIVGLDRVSLSYLRQPSSRLFQGTLFLIAGPKLFGLQVADLKGTLGIEFPSTGPTLLKAKGDLSVVRLPVANAFATYTVGLPGTLDFGGTYKIAFLSGGLKGFVDLGSGFFAASGSAAAGPFGGVAVLSSKGFGACVSVPLAPDPGMRWDWGDAFPEFVCPDLGSFGAGSSAARAAATGVTIPAGQSEAAIAVDGAGGAPEVVVSGPGGETVSGGDSVVEAGRFRVTPSPEASRTYVQIADPPAGSYQVDVRPGSVPITSVRTALPLPEPSVRASVSGKGRRRSLRFRVRRVAGQRVVFAEQAGALFRVLGSTTKARGSLKFRPAAGPGGKRTIVAIVEQDGVPRARLVAARYKAPPSRVRRPRRVGLRRRGRRLAISWSRVAGAHGYRVRVILPRDGRRLLYFPGPRKRGLRIKGVEPSDTAVVTVGALRHDLRPGPERTAKLKPKKRKRKRRGRKGRTKR